MSQELRDRTRREIVRLARAGLDWVTFATEVTEVLRRAIPFDRSCWHPVDPDTVLFTGSLNQNITCSGDWLAEYEYVVEDVNKWWFLARSGRLAGATSLATHGDLSRSARHRSAEPYGIGDELRGSFVGNGTYWAAAGFLRASDRPWFTEEDVRFLASLSETIAEAFPRAQLASALAAQDPAQDEPGVVVFDADGTVESISPAAERGIKELVEVPPPPTPADSKMIHVVAARARALGSAKQPVEAVARSRVQTSSGRWLLLYGTRLSGASERTAVIVQPAPVHEVAPLVALAYGLSEREREITRLCLQGLPTKQMARALAVSPYTIQDHLKSIFEKTGVRSRSELVGQVFLEHYVPRWEDVTHAPAGWFGKSSPVQEGANASEGGEVLARQREAG